MGIHCAWVPQGQRCPVTPESNAGEQGLRARRFRPRQYWCWAHSHPIPFPPPRSAAVLHPRGPYSTGPNTPRGCLLAPPPPQCRRHLHASPGPLKCGRPPPPAASDVAQGHGGCRTACCAASGPRRSGVEALVVVPLVRWCCGGGEGGEGVACLERIALPCCADRSEAHPSGATALSLGGRTVRCARAVRKVGCSPPPGVR